MTIPAINVHMDDPQFVGCLPIVLELEGGNDDDPHDPGGRTSRGVIQREYNAYRALKHLPSRDVWKADWAEIFDIYYVNYWSPWCVKLWPGLNLMYFDQAVNQGPSQSVRNLQKAINAFHDPGTMAWMLRAVHLRSRAVVVDGHMGLLTVAALTSLQDHKGFITAYYNADMNFYRSLKLWWRYGKGWSNRARTVYQTALRLVQPVPVT